MSLETLVEEAKAGSRESLEKVVEAVQDEVYNLSLRMLWHPHDAEDATQEILIRVVTNLGSFRGDSKFRTWVYRIASNQLLATRKRRMEQRPMSFEEFGTDLAEGLSDALLNKYSEAEQQLLIEEVKIGCTHAMLLCLDRDHRLAYILGELMEFTSNEGSAILGIAPPAFRKRLSRSRGRIRQFMESHCGLVNSSVPCRCRRRVKQAVKLGRADPDKLLFTNRTALEKAGAIEMHIAQLDGLLESTAVLRSNPEYDAPGGLLASIRSLLDSGHVRMADR